MRTRKPKPAFVELEGRVTPTFWGNQLLPLDNPWNQKVTNAPVSTNSAAIISHLDLVVTADTAVAHLAGAMDHPLCVLLSFRHDWRWLLDREDSPWYPGARLFRQERPGDWDGVLARVGAELARFVA